MDVETKKEAILDELTAFEKRPNELNEIPELLNEFLVYVAKSGDPLYPWSKVKPLIKKKIDAVVNEFTEKFPSSNIPDLPNVKPFNLNEMKKELIDHLESFNGSPFTLQRICELLTSPYEHYKRADKFMRGLEKNILVVSTIEPKSQGNFSQNTNHKPFFLPTPSSSYQNNASSSSSTTTSFVNGLHEGNSNIANFSDYCDNLVRSPIHHGTANNSHISPAPLQQLDSFTTVFVSPPSTPLAVVSDLSSFENNSSLSPENNVAHQDHVNENSNHSQEQSQDSQTENIDDQEPSSSSSTESGNDSPFDSSPELNSQGSDNEEKQLQDEGQSFSPAPLEAKTQDSFEKTAHESPNSYTLQTFMNATVANDSVNNLKNNNNNNNENKENSTLDQSSAEKICESTEEKKEEEPEKPGENKEKSDDDDDKDVKSIEMDCVEQESEPEKTPKEVESSSPDNIIEASNINENEDKIDVEEKMSDLDEKVDVENIEVDGEDKEDSELTITVAEENSNKSDQIMSDESESEPLSEK